MSRETWDAILLGIGILLLMTPFWFGMPPAAHPAVAVPYCPNPAFPDSWHPCTPHDFPVEVAI